MTKRERQMKAMLEYYQIDIGGVRDEKLSKRDQKKFIDRFNANYDAHTVQDILGKIKDKFKDNKPFDGEESDDPFFDKLKGGSDEEQNPSFPLDLNAFSGRRIGYDDMESSLGPLGMNPEIERFIGWISDILYSADHKVIITEEGDITNIRLEKIKKKRGGRKK